MKITVAVLSCMVLLQSCNTQKADLSLFKFPINKNRLINNEIKFKKEQFLYDDNLIAYEYTESNMLTYANNNLSNSIDDNSATYCGKNYLQLLVDEKTKKNQGYQLHTYTKKESVNLFNSLKRTLGSPNYDDGAIDRHIIWENENSIYILNIGFNSKIQNIETVDANLLVLNNQLEKLILYVNSTTYYESYLKERKRQKKDYKNYSYKTFAEEEKNNGTEYYSKGIKGLK
jgi:hypothetical protein